MNRNSENAGTASNATFDAPPHAASNTTQWLEEGTAFAEMNRDVGVSEVSRSGDTERFDVIVIGGGQAGLSVGYHLARRKIKFVILDERPRVGDAWRRRWDSLRLFTPARFDALDGMPFPGPGDRFPTKDEMADYLESYAAHFRLPVWTGVRVNQLMRNGDYIVTAGERRLEARHVVLAMANYQQARVPELAARLDASIVQIHSADYARPSQLPEGGVLIVGAGNSGAEIAMDLVRHGHRVWLSGRDTGEVPFNVRSPFVRRAILPILFRIVFHRVLSLATPIGRWVRPKFVLKGQPLIRTRSRDLLTAGVARVARTTGVVDGKPQLADGTVLDVSSVVWCTGFHIGPSWIDLPVFDEHAEPIQVRGIANGEPGLYFVGPHFLYSASSSMIHGVGRDARHVVDVIEARLRKMTRQSASAAAG